MTMINAGTGRPSAPPTTPRDRQKRKLTGNLPTWNRASPRWHTPRCLPPASTSTKANGGKNAVKNKQLPAKTADPWDEIAELRKRMDRAKNPDPKDVEHL